MFGKHSAKVETILGDGTTITGGVTVTGTLRIDGSVEGDVRADWVIVGERGRIAGNIRSRGTVVGGSLEGNIEADEIVELKHTAKVRGEIRSAKLVVSEGAAFDGQSRMAAAAAADRAPDEGKVISLKAPGTS